MTVKNVPPYISHFDGNQVPSITGVEGTLGTTDTGGTARPMPIGVNPVTGAMYVQDLSGASGTTNVQIVGGTFNAGTATVNVATGTQQTLGTVGTVIGVGTISNIVTTSGTVTGIGTISNIVTTSGTVTGVGVVSALTTGSVAVTVGTIVGPTASGGTPTTAPVLIAGTDVTGTVYSPKITSGGNLSVVPVSLPSSGTLLNLATGTLAVVTAVTTVSNLTNGSVNILTGTLQSSGTTTGVGVVSSLSELVKGTVTNLVSGTLNALASGTITAGTVRLNATPAGSSVLTTHVLGTGGGTLFGTILATAGAGTNVYVAGLSIVCHSGTVDCGIANNVDGTTGAGVLARGLFSPGGGIARDFNPAINIGAAGTIAYFLISAGTVSLTVNYWVSP